MTTLSRLAEPQKLKLLMQSLAALDAIHSPEWEYRYFSFDAHWGQGEGMGSIRNGSGDTVFVLFNSEGCFLKGYSHEYESAFAPEAFYSGVPDALAAGVTEPAFSPNDVSYCGWRKVEDTQWKSAVAEAELDDDIFFLMRELDGDEETYQNFVSDYHEMETGLEPIKAIYRHNMMTKELASSINPNIDYAALLKNLTEIGYPIQPESEPEALVKTIGFFGKLFRR